MKNVEELLNQLGTTTPHKAFKYRVENLLVRELPVPAKKSFPLLTLRYGLLGLALVLASSSGLVYATAQSKPGSLLFGIKAKVLPKTVSESPITTTPDVSSEVQPTTKPENIDSGQQSTNSTPTTDPTTQPSSGVRIQLTIPKESLLPLLSSENASITITPSPTTNPPTGGQQSTIINASPTPTPSPQSNGISANIEISISTPAPSSTPSNSEINVGVGGLNINLDTPKIGVLGL